MRPRAFRIIYGRTLRTLSPQPNLSPLWVPALYARLMDVQADGAHRFVDWWTPWPPEGVTDVRDPSSQAHRGPRGARV